MGHPAQYSGEKQGDSTDDVYGSPERKKQTYDNQRREFKIEATTMSEKKESARIPIEADKHTDKQIQLQNLSNSKSKSSYGIPYTV